MLLLPGCGFIKEHKKAAIGVGAGALGGAAVGGLVKGKDGAIVGGVIGALAGGAIGAYMDHKDKTAQETLADHDYTADEGLRLEMVKAVVEPEVVKPGDKVMLKATYAVMAPDPEQELVVQEQRTVLLDGTTVADLGVDMNRTTGTYTSEVPLTISGTATPGTYELRIRVTAGGQSSTLGTSFVVQ
jgi:hypothetical protein